MGTFSYAIDQLSEIFYPIRHLSDIIHILAYLLVALIALLKAYKNIDLNGYKRNIYSPLNKKLLTLLRTLYKNKNLKPIFSAIINFYGQIFKIYLVSSRLPYFSKITRPYLNSISKKFNAVKVKIKSYFNKKD